MATRADEQVEPNSGEMVIITVRVPNGLAQEIDALLDRARAGGDPRRTRATVYRELLVLGLKAMRKEIK